MEWSRSGENSADNGDVIYQFHKKLGALPIFDKSSLLLQMFLPIIMSCRHHYQSEEDLPAI